MPLGLGLGLGKVAGPQGVDQGRVPDVCRMLQCLTPLCLSSSWVFWLFPVCFPEHVLISSPINPAEPGTRRYSLNVSHTVWADIVPAFRLTENRGAGKPCHEKRGELPSQLLRPDRPVSKPEATISVTTMSFTQAHPRTRVPHCWYVVSVLVWVNQTICNLYGMGFFC